VGAAGEFAAGGAVAGCSFAGRGGAGVGEAGAGAGAAEGDFLGGFWWHVWIDLLGVLLFAFLLLGVFWACRFVLVWSGGVGGVGGVV
jgi:hypothetical protein